MARYAKDPVFIRSETYQLYHLNQNSALVKNRCDTCSHVISMKDIDQNQDEFCATYAPGKYCNLACMVGAKETETIIVDLTTISYAKN